MDIFKDVKAAVSTREAAERYGVPVSRSGMACCIFHSDRHPSMKVDSRYHCFACGADGDVIAFTAQLFGLTPMMAAEKLARDFGVDVTHRSAFGSKSAQGAQPARVCAAAPYDKTAYPVRVFGEYRAILQQLRAAYAPKSPSEPLDARFCEAVHCLDYVCEAEKWLRAQTPQTRADWLILHRKEVENIEQRVRSHKRLSREHRARNAGKDLEG